MTDREAFEESCILAHVPVLKDDSGRYVDSLTESMWKGWAMRSALVPAEVVLKGMRPGGISVLVVYSDGTKSVLIETDAGLINQSKKIPVVPVRL